MNIQKNEGLRTFKPRSSRGWVWLILMAVIIASLAIAPALAGGTMSFNTLLTLAICLPIATAFLILGMWFPSMRYELERRELTLYYGPILRYRIPLSTIQTIRKRDLSLTIWSTVRFPGIALFSVPYGDVGNVKMCATAALQNILLIETDKEKYGITPADEAAFIQALRERMEA